MLSICFQNQPKKNLINFFLIEWQRMFQAQRFIDLNYEQKIKKNNNFNKLLITNILYYREVKRRELLVHLDWNLQVPLIFFRLKHGFSCFQLAKYYWLRLQFVVNQTFQLINNYMKLIQKSYFLYTQNVKNYYTILGINRMSTSVQIKDKYFQLAKQFHPDVSKDPEHTKKFTLINEAYDTLKDQTKRRNYDQTLDFENYNVHQNKSAFTQQNYKSYDGTQRVYRPRYEDYDQNYQKTYQRARQQFRNRLIVNFAFGFLATIAAFLFLSKRDIPDENQIRRKNLILANQNINSSPQAISRRQIQYAQQMKDKKFSIVVVQKQLNRYGNAFLNRQQMKDKNKIGKSLSTIQRTHKKPQILRIPGIKKISENQNTQNIQIHAQQYI